MKQTLIVYADNFHSKRAASIIYDYLIHEKIKIYADIEISCGADYDYAELLMWFDTVIIVGESPYTPNQLKSLYKEDTINLTLLDNSEDGYFNALKNKYDCCNGVLEVGTPLEILAYIYCYDPLKANAYDVDPAELPIEPNTRAMFELNADMRRMTV